MKNNNKHHQHYPHYRKKKHKEPTNFEEYQVGDMSYEEMCEYADFLFEFFEIAERTAPIEEYDYDDLDAYEGDEPERW